MDIAAAGLPDDHIRWYVNDRTGTVWTQTIEAGWFNEAWGIHIADLDGDGDAALLGAADAARPERRRVLREERSERSGGRVCGPWASAVRRRR
jgi:hypothetical protein